MSEISILASSVGSEIFALVAELVICGVVLLILRYYLPLRTTPAYTLVPIFFSLVLPASIVLLVPIDLASHASTTDKDVSRGIQLPDRLLLVSWRITYWLTFCLTWFILSILAEYSDAGYREPIARLQYSLRSNAQYYAIVFGLGAAGLIYIFLSYGFNLNSFESTLMALAYCWGLMLAVYLMGHGLVSIPRTLFRNASISGKLRRLQERAVKVHDSMDEAIQKLEDVEAQVMVLSQRKSTGTARDFKEWIEELEDMSSLPDARPRTASRRMSQPTVSVPQVVTERYLAELTRQLVRARHSRVRWIDEWEHLLQDATFTQDILNSSTSRTLTLGSSSPHSSFFERFPIFTPHTRYLYYSYILPYTRIFFGGLLSLASICIIWSELIKAKPGLSIIALTVIHHPSEEGGQVGLFGQFIAACWICYMCAAALVSLTEVKVWRGRALVRRNTAAESAFWYATQVAKLSVPLAYNFLTFLPPPLYRHTIFYDFLGQLIVLSRLGAWFDFLFPMFVLVPVCATLFNLYGKVKRAVGWGGGAWLDGEFSDDEEESGAGEGANLRGRGLDGYGLGGWREGRDLIEREVGGVGGSLSHLRTTNPSTSTSTRPSASTRPAPPSSSSTRPTTTTNRPTQNTTTRPTRTTTQPEDENFFEGFAHRVRNTFETVNRPKWMMGGGDSNGSEGSGGGSGGGGFGTDGVAGARDRIVRLFGGGGGGDGRVRL